MPDVLVVNKADQAKLARRASRLRAAVLAGSFLAYSSLAAGEDRKPWNVNMSFMQGEEECLPPPVAGTGQYGRHPYSYTIKYGYQGMTVSGVGVIKAYPPSLPPKAVVRDAPVVVMNPPAPGMNPPALVVSPPAPLISDRDAVMNDQF